jgi:aminoglycoside phosphotransferase (APT) family kinase protein
VSHPSEQIIDVRPGEELDEAAVADFLAGKLPGADGDLSVRQFGGGKANLTYLLDYGSHQYVLRRPPLGDVAESAHDMKREFTVLDRLHDAFPLAPEAFVYCDDEGVIGSEFFVMERRTGVVVRESMPEAYAGMDDAPERMSAALIDTLADFHAVDDQAIGLSDLGRPDGFIERQIKGWHRRWQQAKHEDLPVVEHVYHWLLENQPSETDATLVHNDYKLDNLMLAPDDPGDPVAVLDWDMCTLGDPLSDLGAVLTYWVQAGDPEPFRQFATMPVDDRFPTRAELVKRYADRSGRDTSDIGFYHVLGLFRLTVIVAQIYIRYVRGQTQDERFAGLAPMIEVTAHAAADRAQRQQAESPTSSRDA